MRWILQLFWFLLSAEVAAGPIRITEFSAESSDGIVRDEEGQTSDWIELRNASHEIIGLKGLYLTDDHEDSTKWQFPAITLPANGFLVVFASGKNRKPTDGSPLHTNFALDRDGE